MLLLPLLISETIVAHQVAFPAPLHPISFDLQRDVPCPFYASGIYEMGDSEECADEFMEERQRKLPRCGEYCCHGAPRGQFRHRGEKYTYVPLKLEQCSYFEYTRSEVGHLVIMQLSVGPVMRGLWQSVAQGRI